MCRSFCELAEEDAQANYHYGIECLFRFYSYGLENTFREDLYRAFEEATLRVCERVIASDRRFAEPTSNEYCIA